MVTELWLMGSLHIYLQQMTACAATDEFCCAGPLSVVVQSAGQYKPCLSKMQLLGLSSLTGVHGWRALSLQLLSVSTPSIDRDNTAAVPGRSTVQLHRSPLAWLRSLVLLIAELGTQMSSSQQCTCQQLEHPAGSTQTSHLSTKTATGVGKSQSL